MKYYIYESIRNHATMYLDAPVCQFYGFMVDTKELVSSDGRYNLGVI